MEEPVMAIDLKEPHFLPINIQPVIEEPIPDYGDNPPVVPEVRMRHSSSYEPEKDR
jgi:hypothetical protein